MRASEDSSARLRGAPRTDRHPDGSRSGRGAHTRGRAAAPLFGRIAPSRGRGVLLLVALAVGGVVGLARFVGRPAAEAGPPTTTLSPEARAALARVRELEARIAELEAEQAAAKSRDASPEPTASTVPTGGAAAPADTSPVISKPPGPTGPTPAGPAEGELRARERAESRRRVEAERQRREAELRQLAQQKEEAEARLVLEQGRAAAAADGTTALPTVAPPPPTPAPTPAPPPERGSFAELSDPDVVPPVLVHDARVDYPPAAERAQKEATVILDVLVDENGRVAEARVVEAAAHKLGFEDAALRAVRSRRYKPATKRGVPVKVHLTVRVAFTLAP